MLFRTRILSDVGVFHQQLHQLKSSLPTVIFTVAIPTLFKRKTLRISAVLKIIFIR